MSGAIRAAVASAPLLRGMATHATMAAGEGHIGAAKKKD
eukprot:gene38047-6842_t